MNKNTKLLFIHKVLWEIYLYGVLVIPLFISKGYQVDIALWLVSIYLIASILFEVPTGSIADRFGHKTSLVLASLLTGVALLSLLYSDGILWDIAVLIVLACGASLNSGSDIGLLKQISSDFTRDNRSFEYLKNVMLMISFAVAGVIADTLGLKEAMLLTGVMTILSGVPLLFIAQTAATSSKKYTYWQTISTIPKALSRLGRGKVLILLIATAGGFSAVSKEIASALNDVYDINLTIIGLIAAALMGARVLGVYLEKIFKIHDRALLFVLGVTVCSTVFIGVNQALGIIAIFLGTMCGHALFFRMKYELSLLAPDSHIASLLSVGSLSRRLAVSIYLFILGLFAAQDKFHLFFVFLSVVYFISLFFVDKKALSK